ncbi:oocyte zinc finger protein XlCOF6-like [Arapaima gigas]
MVKQGLQRQRVQCNSVKKPHHLGRKGVVQEKESSVLSNLQSERQRPATDSVAVISKCAADEGVGQDRAEPIQKDEGLEADSDLQGGLKTTEENSVEAEDDPDGNPNSDPEHCDKADARGNSEQEAELGE